MTVSEMRQHLQSHGVYVPPDWDETRIAALYSEFADREPDPVPEIPDWEPGSPRG